MNAWQDFIEQQIIGLPCSRNALSPLTSFGLLYVGGEDAESFLQNQCSNDITKIDASHAQLSSFSNAKGRMLAIFRVIAIEGGYLLVMPRAVIADAQDQLQKFVLRSQVVLADISDSFAMIAISGDELLFEDDARFPDQVNAVTQTDSMIVLRLHASSEQARFLVLSNDAEEAIALWQEQAQQLLPSAEVSWRLQEIEAGVPNVYPGTIGAFVLQMTNLQLIDGVSFKKGCYPGQEVVARMQYLGKLKRRMYRVTLASDTCPDPGAEMVAADGDGAESVGKIVDAVQASPGHCEMLVVSRIDKAEADALQLARQPDAKVKVETLPYPFEAEDAD